MEIEDTPLGGLKVLRPRVFTDDRGYFFESHQAQRFAGAGIDTEFVQDNVSYSQGPVLRGLHLQNPKGQAKLASTLTSFEAWA